MNSSNLNIHNIISNEEEQKAFNQFNPTYSSCKPNKNLCNMLYKFCEDYTIVRLDPKEVVQTISTLLQKHSIPYNINSRVQGGKVDVEQFTSLLANDHTFAKKIDHKYSQKCRKALTSYPKIYNQYVEDREFSDTHVGKLEMIGKQLKSTLTSRS